MLVFILILSIIGCENNVIPKDSNKKKQFNSELADELSRMVELDQVAAYIPEGKYKTLSKEEWQSFKDSVFTTHQKQLDKMFNQYGYLGFDQVGEKGSDNFWLMVQHCDFDPVFQQKVLDAMELELKNDNANKQNYAYLTDRVRINTGKKIVYGTQVTYNEFGQAISQPLEDSLNVNERRKEVGLESLEEYLNMMTKSHFEMNKEYLLSKGISEPMLHKLNP